MTSFPNRRNPPRHHHQTHQSGEKEPDKVFSNYENPNQQFVLSYGDEKSGLKLDDLSPSRGEKVTSLGEHIF